ncbi:MAG: ATP-binding protein [Rikenellaceae bacterium]|nr:ATP-binding protein [Rikenellaceae bacterium]
MKSNERPLTIIAAIDRIIEGAKDCELKMSKIKPSIKKTISYLGERLALTPMQTLLLSAFINYGDESYVEIRELASLFNCPRIRVISYQSDIDELCRRKLIRYRESDNDYVIPRAVIRAFSNDEPYNAQINRCENEDALFDQIATLCEERRNSHISYSDYCEEMEMILTTNNHLEFVKLLNKEELDPLDKLFFVWCCNMLINEDDTDICEIDMRRMIGNKRGLIRRLRESLMTGANALIENNLLSYSFNDGLSSRESFVISDKSKKTLLKSLIVASSTAPRCKDLLPYTKITAKELFYNASERQAIDRLESLLRPENFKLVCERLSNQGMRRGFACLFYGAPGTGKTETVLQLARRCGRDIMQVNISTIKSKWVGESEKNIKEIFDRYRTAVEHSEVAPILLFNEADAIISQRMNNAQRSVDKMDNAIQNIILEEIEKLDGILIATTNLAGNMDSAFERRFIYKIEFKKPTVEAKCSIWKSMIPSLDESVVNMVAQKYDFSGGEIENIARKYSVEYVLTGKHADIETLTDICDNEQLNKNKHIRIGF